MSKLKTLEEWNNERFQEHKDKSEEIRYPKPNGIECPQCKGELSDTDSCMLMSSPPKKNVLCEQCSYRGYRIA